MIGCRMAPAAGCGRTGDAHDLYSDLWDADCSQGNGKRLGVYPDFLCVLERILKITFKGVTTQATPLNVICYIPVITVMTLNSSEFRVFFMARPSSISRSMI